MQIRRCLSAPESALGAYLIKAYWERSDCTQGSLWQRTGSAQAADWERTGSGLGADWKRTGSGLEAHWERTGFSQSYVYFEYKSVKEEVRFLLVESTPVNGGLL